MRDSHAHERLPRTRHAGQQHEATCARQACVRHDARDVIDGVVSIGRSVPQSRRPALQEKLSRRPNQARERSVGVGFQKAPRVDRRSDAPGIQVTNQRIQRIGPTDADVSLRCGLASHERGDKDRVDRSVVTLAVITAKVASVRVSLVNVSVGRQPLPLELNHDDTVAQQQHGVGTPRLHGQLILEHGRTAAAIGIDANYFANLLLELGNGVAPRPNFLT